MNDLLTLFVFDPSTQSPAQAADENSRILDRERAAMQAMGIMVRLCDIPGRVLRHLGVGKA